MTWTTERILDSVFLVFKALAGVIILRIIFRAAGYDRYIPLVDDLLNYTFRLADRILP